MSKSKTIRPVISGYDVLKLLEETYACAPAVAYVKKNLARSFNELWNECPEEDWRRWLVSTLQRRGYSIDDDDVKLTKRGDCSLGDPNCPSCREPRRDGVRRLGALVRDALTE